MTGQYLWHDWLRLMQVQGVGNDTARKLLNAFGLPENIFASSHSALTEVVSPKIASAILGKMDDKKQSQLALCEEWSQQAGNFVITLADKEYPSALLEIADPPILLYVKGRVDLLSAPTVAVVGSRNASAQGIQNAEDFSHVLSQAGITISSGLAAGIDAAAHQGGLKGIGSTVAVIGTGADIVYPARNRALAHLIVEGGCIVSEYPLGTPAMVSNFPRRNRIISGLATAVLVVEAAAQSGSLITARMAAEQGRDVFAIPGSIHSPLVKGCHQLIKQGAKLVETAQDILDEINMVSVVPILPMNSTQLASQDSSQEECMSEQMNEHTSKSISECIDESSDSLLNKIGYDPVHLDILVERTSLAMAELSAQLFTLELQGVVAYLPGGMVQRIGSSRK